MKVRKTVAVGTMLCLLACLAPRCYAVDTPEISARSAIVLDRVSGTVLFEKNADQRSLIASTTKIMTGLLVCENCDLNQVVCVDQAACGIEGSSLYLKPGERCTVEELLYGMMLHSGNDAATALAIAACGSEAAFVDQMNRRAAALGLAHTHFANPHGLDSEQNYSTARDLAKLTAAALAHPIFARVVATDSITIADRCLTNHNKLLWRYEGADGVKTGYTKTAGRILVSSATRGGRQLVAVTVHAPDDWRDHEKLLDHGFLFMNEQTVITAGETLGMLPLADGAFVYLNADQTVTVNLMDAEQPHIRLLVPRFLYAPVSPDQPVGTAQVMVGQTVIGSCTLCAGLP